MMHVTYALMVMVMCPVMEHMNVACRRSQQSCLHLVSLGHELCRELRKTVPASLVPIIMLSAKNNEENVVEGLQNGCNDFVR